MRARPDDVTKDCWRRRHDSCTGYTEPESDPELCNCACHDEHEPPEATVWCPCGEYRALPHKTYCPVCLDEQTRKDEK